MGGDETEGRTAMEGEELLAPERGRGGGGGGGGRTETSVIPGGGALSCWWRAGEPMCRGGAMGGGAGCSTPGAIWRGAGAGGMAMGCWEGRGGMGGGGVPRMPAPDWMVEGRGGGGGGKGGGGGGGVLELKKPGLRAGD